MNIKILRLRSRAMSDNPFFGLHEQAIGSEGSL